VCVNTDSARITDMIHNELPEVIIHNRPTEIRGDFVSMNRIIEWDMNQFAQEHFLQTHATNPLLTSESVEQALTAYFQRLDIHDSLYSVTRHQARFYDAEGDPVNHNPGELLRTQDLPPLFEENSCLYVFSKSSFARMGARIGSRPQMFEMSAREAIDIDTEMDFQMAEMLYKQRQENL